MKRLCLVPGLCFLLCALLGGCAASGNFLPADPTMGGLVRAYSAEEISAAPMAIDGKIVKDSNLTGLRLENITLRDTTFWRCEGKNIVFRNVVFENCRFLDVDLSGGSMENVTFKGGVLTCDYDRDNLPARTIFSGMVMENLVFDGATLENTVLDLKRGSVTLRGMHVIRALEPLIRGRDTRLTLENCILINIPALTALAGASTLTARDCTFSGTAIDRGQFTAIN